MLRPARSPCKVCLERQRMVDPETPIHPPLEGVRPFGCVQERAFLTLSIIWKATHERK